MDDNQLRFSLEDSLDDSHDSWQQWARRVITGPVIVSFLLWLVLSSRWPLIETRLEDVLLLWLVALVGAAFWILRDAAGARFTSETGWSSLRVVLIIAMSLADVMPCLNGVLDRQAAVTYEVVIIRKDCYRSTCHLEVAGFHGLPVAAPTMTLGESRWFGADPGDLMVLAVKPGFLGRAWMLSEQVHRIKRRQQDSGRDSTP